MLKRSLPSTPTSLEQPFSSSFTRSPALKRLILSRYLHHCSNSIHQQRHPALPDSFPISSSTFDSLSSVQGCAVDQTAFTAEEEVEGDEQGRRKRRKLLRRHSFSSSSALLLSDTEVTTSFDCVDQASGTLSCQDVLVAPQVEGPPSLASILIRPPLVPIASYREEPLFSKTESGCSKVLATPSVLIDTNIDMADNEALRGVSNASSTVSQAGSSSRETLDATSSAPQRRLPLRLSQEHVPLSLGHVDSSASATAPSRPRKRPAKLSLNVAPAAPSSALSSRLAGASAQHSALNAPQWNLSTRSVPSSPVVSNPPKGEGEDGHQLASQQDEESRQLRDNLRGAPRRRPSVPFGLRIAPPPALIIPKKAFTAMAPTANSPSSSVGGARQPPIWQDPSEHILSGNGSSLQHARSVYAAGPVEVLPGLYLGDEFNACNDRCLAERGITTILNVAKETNLPFQSEKGVTEDPASLDLSRKFEEHLKLRRRSEVTTPTSSTRSAKPTVTSLVDIPPVTATHETFFTPMSAFAPSSTFAPKAATKLDRVEERIPRKVRPTSMLPTSKTETTIYEKGREEQGPSTRGDANPSHPPTPSASSLLRNTTSTPNLYSRFRSISSPPLPNKRRNSKVEKDSDDEDEFVDTSESLCIDASMTPTESRELSRDRELARRKLNGIHVDDEDGASGSLTTSPISSHLSLFSEDTTPPSPSLALPDETAFRKAYPTSETSPASSREDARGTTTATNPSTAASSSSNSPISAVPLPANAIALKIPPSPSSGRKEELRYVKLPWTHDEMDLAAMETGGFVVGCSIIAQALGIDLTTGQFSPGSQEREAKRGSILVHCQCGVSRSATLVIAFVMQAAALGYPFTRTKNLTGMHDCYEMVKDLSSSISPNCSLIYQLVEWERHLSKEANKRRAATLGADAAPLLESMASAPDASSSAYTDTALPAGDELGVAQIGSQIQAQSKGWGKEAMDEEDWTRMRLEEERKEAEEDELNRQRRLQEAMEQQRRTQDREREREKDHVVLDEDNSPSSSSPSSSAGGLGSRRKKKTPSLSLHLETSAGSGVEKRENMEQTAAAPNSVLPRQKINVRASNLGPTHERREEEEAEEGSSGDLARHRETARDSLLVPPQKPDHLGLSPSKSMPGSLPLPSPFEHVEDTPTTASPQTPSTALSSSKLQQHQPQYESQNGSSKARPRSLQAAPEGYAAGRPATSPFNAKASAPLISASSSSSSSCVFGALGQSAQERKAKHRRTFSSELPSWKSTPSLTVLLDQSAGSRSGEQ